ncbi:hypothetical protein [Sodalis-like endosymbiont of Proechinophthirus fluctus]|uniref:hypothetical protein n=1 Tax=Sodalis-like endosymbiont of Proechinophthirus fluctus TaxID=1462730 RepID=UPI000A595098|nr:hypothetical protein [Sodalis-like endosymbiont of Proechinophthirus fluctus]
MSGGSINQNNLPYAELTNEMQVCFSMRYSLAVALAKNQLRLAGFDRERMF